MAINFVEFGVTVKEIRTACKMTQEMVSKETGIAIETLRRLENGYQEPKISTIEKLSILYKYDLINLLESSRYDTDFLSDTLISKTNNYLKIMDYEGLRKEINNLLKFQILEQEKDLKYAKYLSGYLEALSTIEFNTTKNLKTDIGNLERLLFFFDKNNLFLEDRYLFSIEVSVGIYLMIFTRQDKQYDRSIQIGMKLLSKIKNLPSHTKRQINHIGTIYLNISYAYHSLNQHEKVIEIITDVLQFKNLTFSNYLYNEFMFRKAIAMYHLNDPNYIHIISSAILNETEDRKHKICKMLKKIYKIEHNTCPVCTGK